MLDSQMLNQTRQFQNQLKGQNWLCPQLDRISLIYVFLGQGTSWQQNLDKFETFAKASLQLCKAYIETSCHGGGVKELSAAIMHLRNTLKQVMYKACVLSEANISIALHGFVNITEDICIKIIN
jgi:hypothetical protein